MTIRSSFVLSAALFAGVAAPAFSLNNDASTVQNISAAPAALHQLAGSWGGSVDLGYEDGTNSSSDSKVFARFEPGQDGAVSLVLAYDTAARGKPFNGAARITFHADSTIAFTGFDGRLNATMLSAGMFESSVNQLTCKGQATKSAGGAKMDCRQVIRVERENEIAVEFLVTQNGQEDTVMKFWLNRLPNNEVATSAKNLLNDKSLLAKINTKGQNTANADGE